MRPSGGGGGARAVTRHPRAAHTRLPATPRPPTRGLPDAPAPRPRAPRHASLRALPSPHPLSASPPRARPPPTPPSLPLSSLPLPLSLARLGVADQERCQREGLGASCFFHLRPRSQIQGERLSSLGPKIPVVMVPAEMGGVAAADKLVHGPISGKKCQKKAPRKIHKAEREKLKRDQLNDLFVELGSMLEADRQSNGKACILTDTTRILRDLLSQVEALRQENNTLQKESQYVTMERNELQDESSALRNEIVELQNELSLRLSGNPVWGHGATGSPSPAPHTTSRVFSSHQSMQPPAITGTAFPLQQPLQQPTVIEHSYAAPPRELKLFPEATTTEGHEPSGEQEAPSHVGVARPQARYPTEAASWPVSLGLPRMEDEQCSSSTTGSSKEASTGSD